MLEEEAAAGARLGLLKQPAPGSVGGSWMRATFARSPATWRKVMKPPTVLAARTPCRHRCRCGLHLRMAIGGDGGRGPALEHRLLRCCRRHRAALTPGPSAHQVLLSGSAPAALSTVLRPRCQPCGDTRHHQPQTQPPPAAATRKSLHILWTSCGHPMDILWTSCLQRPEKVFTSYGHPSVWA